MGKNDSTLEQIFSIADAAQRLSLTPETVRRLIRRGALKATKTNGKHGYYRIRASAINHFLDHG